MDEKEIAAEMKNCVQGKCQRSNLRVIKKPDSDVISHLFGYTAKRVTCALSPSGRKGLQLGRENWDKG